jgi:plastocyanin
MNINCRFMVVALVACFAASACTKHPAASPSSNAASSSKTTSKTTSLARVATVTVMVQSSGFQPVSVTVAPGTNVVWIQSDPDDKVSHAVVSGTPGHPDNKFSSIGLKKGASFTIAPSAPGTYAYFDGQHPSLTGALAVATAGRSGSPAPGSST